ncbi:unnamed protein product [Rhodiola kirilowii]
MSNYLVPLNAHVATEENLLGLPHGFRFHPTDEEIVVHYLIPKLMNSEFSAVAVGQVDFNKCEPWDLPRVANIGEKEERYYYCLRDKKYPAGLRTNRATSAGYWKATGKDREIYTGNGGDQREELIGMKKTLVFYKGRAPRGEKTNWVMHEFRLLLPQISLLPQNDGWVVSRVFHKNNAGDGGNGNGTMPKHDTCTGNESSFSQIQKSDDYFSTDDLIKDDEFESLPPLVDPFSAAPNAPQLEEFKPTIKASFSPISESNGFFSHQPIDHMQQAYNMLWHPSSSVFDDAYEEDQLIYAADPSYYYPTFSEPLFQVPANPYKFEQPKVENNVVEPMMEDFNFNQGNVEQHCAPSAAVGFSHDAEIGFNDMIINNNGQDSVPGLSNPWGYC